MKTIGMVSRIEKGKGQDILIEAVSILKKKRNDVKTIIVGEGDDSDLKIKIKKLNLVNDIKILGFQRRLDKILAEMDVFVFPTYWPLEGFGLVLLEAMRAGIPIVSTDFGPVPEIVSGVALLVPPKDPDRLSKAILKVLNDKQMSRTMILRGKERVKQFDINRIAGLYLDNISRVVKSNV